MVGQEVRGWPRIEMGIGNFEMLAGSVPESPTTVGRRFRFWPFVASSRDQSRYRSSDPSNLASLFHGQIRKVCLRI